MEGYFGPVPTEACSTERLPDHAAKPAVGQRVALVNRGSISLPSGHPFGAPLPGSEVAAINLAEALAADGFDVTYFGAHDPNAHIDRVRIASVEHIWDEPDGADLRIVWLRDYRHTNQSIRHFRQARQILWTEDSARDMRKFYRGQPLQPTQVLPTYTERFDAVVFASKWHRDDWGAMLGIQPSNWHVIYNSVRHTSWASRREPTWPARVVHTAHPRKALAAVAAVAERIHRLGYSVTCCSSPELYQDDQCRIIVPTEGGFRSLGSFAEFTAAHGGALEMVPPNPVAGQAAFLDGFDVLLHPDYTEETGANVVLEAMRRGLVPIVSSVGALPEIVEGAGIVIDGKPWTDEFADACSRSILELDGTRLDELASRRTSAAAKFADGAVVDAWRRLLIDGPQHTPRADRGGIRC